MGKKEIGNSRILSTSCDPLSKMENIKKKKKGKNLIPTLSTKGTHNSLSNSECLWQGKRRLAYFVAYLFGLLLMELI